MKLFYTLLALFFVVGSFVEYVVTRKEDNYYSLTDFKSSVQLMLSALVFDVAIKAAVVYLFTKLSVFSLFQLGYQWWVWVVCYVTWDFIFYIKHYLEHNVRFMWAIHVNHHSSRHMNLSTSLRSGVFKSTYRYFFWSIIVIIGFPLPMFLIVYGVGKVWAFFSHSQKLGKWGLLEKFTITPTHHLLHHSCNEDNLNKNFGETFLLWDQLFGTYKESDATRLMFGIQEDVNHKDFNEVVFHEIKRMKNDFKAASGWKAKLNVIFGKPV